MREWNLRSQRFRHSFISTSVRPELDTKGEKTAIFSLFPCKRRDARYIENNLPRRDITHILIRRVADQRLPRLLIRDLIRQLPVVPESNVHRVQRHTVRKVLKHDAGAAGRRTRMEAFHVLDGHFSGFGVECYDRTTVTV